MEGITFPEITQVKAIKLTPNALEFEYFTTNNDNTDVATPTTGVQATILSHKCLTEDVMEMTLEAKLDFEPGDSIGITPKNPQAVVDELLDYFEARDLSFKVTGKVPPHLQEGRVIDIIYDLDIYTFPKKQYFRHMAEYAEGNNRHQLLILSSISGKPVYQELQARRPTLLQLFKWFQVKLPLGVFLEHTPAIIPRYYSCSLLSPNFTFAFNIVKQGDFKGLCSNWLYDIRNENISIPVFKRQAPVLFKVPETGNPVLICNGTGVAPFVGFVQQLAQQGRTCTLLYGHRTQKDAIYKEVLQQFVDSNVLNMIECLSREDGGYVQDQLHKIESLFNEPVLVCGYAMFM